MPGINWIPIGIATGMASIDSLAFSILKKISLKELGMMFLPVSMIMYAMQPAIFLQALRYENMTIVNLLWTMMSNILVTFTGLVLLKEKVGFFKGIGIALSFIAMYLMTYEDGESELVGAIQSVFGLKT